MRSYENKLGWMKIGTVTQVIFIAKDVLAYGKGCFIHFYNVKTKQESTYQATIHQNNGEGVTCLVGHGHNLVFSFTEACSYPNTYILAYPSFKEVCCIPGAQIQSPLQATFSHSSLFIMLTAAPIFNIVVYNYVTGEKVCETRSDFFHSEQIMKCNVGKPEYMIQLGVNSTDICMWDMFTVCRVLVLTKHTMKFSTQNPVPFCNAIWANDNQLYFIDQQGSIYMADPNMYINKIIDRSITEIKTKPYLSWFGGGILVVGPDNIIKKYKKTETDWTEITSIEPPRGITTLTTNKSNLIMYINKDLDFVWLDEDCNELTDFFSPPSLFLHVVILHPTGDYVIAVGNLNKLYVFKIATGDLVSTLQIRNGSLSLAENPEFPYVAVGYKDGVLQLISLFKADEPSLMATFHLTRNPITHLYFCTYGKIIVTGYLDIGEFFILEGFPGGTIKVVACVQTQLQVVDFMLVASKTCHRLFIIPVTTRLRRAGNKFVRYCVLGKDKIAKKEYVIQNKNIFYHKICATNNINRDRVFYAVPVGSKHIHEIETKRGSENANVISVTHTGHLLSHFNIRITKSHFITCGYDGLVIVRDPAFQKEIGMSMMHHRRYDGVCCASVDPLDQYIVSFGRENVIVCTKLLGNPVNLKKKLDLMAVMKSAVFTSIFERRTKGFVPKGDLARKTWLEVEEYNKFQEDTARCKVARERIVADLNKIKTTIQGLVTANLEGPENQKLELSEFNLNIAAYKDLCKKNDEQCDYLNKYYRQLIAEQDKVFNYIKGKYFDSMRIIETQLRAIFKNSIVANYSLEYADAMKMEEIERMIEYLKMEALCSNTDRFLPWIRYSESQLMLLKNDRPKLDEDTAMSLQNLEIKDAKQISSDTVLCLDGTMSKMFIEKPITTQTNMTTFVQLHHQNSVMLQTIGQLKEVFNKEFQNLMEMKEREVQALREKNARQRKIVSETNYFSTNMISVAIDDPEWTIEEIPAQIVQVLDNEMTITPYISPSEQVILDAKAAEAERIRLLLLADDFKERALMAMMNGVLEIRWEDELKKEVPLPKCMIEKDPLNFNEDDLRAVKDYEDKVVFLKSERERYKGLLEKEFTKNCVNIKESIKRFNIKVSDLNTLKMNIESAIIQEQLIMNTRRMWQITVLEMYSKHMKILDDIQSNDQNIEELTKMSHYLEDIVKEYKSKNESINMKDKLIEKNFKREISECSPIVQDIAVKTFRKRPRASYKQINSSTILHELSKCIASGERSIALNPEALDFLNSLENLDSLVGLPPNIDEHTYANICKIRRSKIELEVKLRALLLEISYSEGIIALYSKRLANGKEIHINLNSELNAIRQNLLRISYNIVMQMVIRSGFVEIPLTGHLEDYDNAILIPWEEVTYINKLIRAAGKLKLNTMEKNMAFHRKVMDHEWRHVRKRMVLNDLSEQLSDILDVKMTKEVQKYLKSKKRGDNLKATTYEMELEQQKQSFLQQIKEMHKEKSYFRKQIQITKERTEIIDKDIYLANIAINTYKNQINPEILQKDDDLKKSRMKCIVKRSSLIQQMQQNHNEILMLQTELELLRLKTYPTFQYKVLHKSQ